MTARTRTFQRAAVGVSAAEAPAEAPAPVEKAAETPASATEAPAATDDTPEPAGEAQRAPEADVVEEDEAAGPAAAAAPPAPGFAARPLLNLLTQSSRELAAVLKKLDERDAAVKNLIEECKKINVKPSDVMTVLAAAGLEYDRAAGAVTLKTAIDEW